MEELALLLTKNEELALQILYTAAIIWIGVFVIDLYYKNKDKKKTPQKQRVKGEVIKPH